MEHQQLSAGDGTPSVSVVQTGIPRPSCEAFSDPRAIIVRHERPAPGFPLDTLSISQAEDGPTYIHVGRLCSDAYLQSLWEGRTRFRQLTLDQLQAVRDGRIERCEVAS